MGMSRTINLLCFITIYGVFFIPALLRFFAIDDEYAEKAFHGPHFFNGSFLDQKMRVEINGGVVGLSPGSKSGLHFVQHALI